MNLNFRACEMTKWTKVAMVAMALILAPAVARADVFDITTLPGYQVVTTNVLDFGDGGLAGWSVPNGKVILGAKIISAGDTVSDFSVFRPTTPGETWNGYTLGVGEYGWAFADVNNGANNPGVKVELYYASLMPGYTITKSSTLGYSGTGWGGWSAPAGNVVSGGGFAFSNTSASPASSQFADELSVWSHYTFGANEEGWVVQNGGTASSANVYVISFDRPTSVPDGGTTLALLGGALVGLAALRRKFSV